MELYGNNAIVELHNGKYGVLQIIDKSFSLKLNKGEAIPFKHRRFQTVVYLDMPKDISPENVTLISNDEYGCNIDVLSKTQRVTESGNRIQYDCTLNFPKSLPDEMLYNENNKLKYDAGFISSYIKFKEKENVPVYVLKKKEKKDEN